MWAILQLLSASSVVREAIVLYEIAGITWGLDLNPMSGSECVNLFRTGYGLIVELLDTLENQLSRCSAELDLIDASTRWSTDWESLDSPYILVL